MHAVAFLVVLIAAVALARPQTPSIIPVLSRTEVRDEVGQFALSFATGNGIIASEQGALKPTADGKDLVLVKQGSYSYTAPDGTPITLTYTADENGFKAVGAHIPVSVVA